MAVDAAPESGDPACWLDQICDTCGGFIDCDEDHVCRPPARDAESAPPAGA